jgi:hypothetical protein
MEAKKRKMARMRTDDGTKSRKPAGVASGQVVLSCDRGRPNLRNMGPEAAHHLLSIKETHMPSYLLEPPGCYRNF